VIPKLVCRCKFLYGNIGCLTKLTADHLDAWRAVLNTHARLTGAIERALADHGLPPLAWYDVLWALHRSGKTLRMGELADAATISRSGLTRLVDRLEAEGLLERRPAKDDRRAVDVTITATGSRLLRGMWPVYEQVLREVFQAKLSRADARAVSSALAKL
jgi:DNA-binding MarR family transcriptional regulator